MTAALFARILVLLSGVARCIGHCHCDILSLNHVSCINLLLILRGYNENLLHVWLMQITGYFIA